MRLKIFILLLALSGIRCFAGNSEFYLTSIKQNVPATFPFDATTYRIAVISYIYEPDQEKTHPAFQWCFSIGDSPGNHPTANSSPGSSWHKTNGFASCGVRCISRGSLRFGGAIDVRLTGEGEGGSSGDTANGSTIIRTPVWFSAIAQYQFKSSSVSPIISIHYGLTNTHSTGEPDKEFGLSFGVRF